MGTPVCLPHHHESPATDVPGHRIAGKGDVDLARGPETGGEMALDFRFRELEVSRERAEAPMLVGHELLFRIGGDGRVLPDPDRLNDHWVLKHAGDYLRNPTAVFRVDADGIPDDANSARVLARNAYSMGGQ